MNTNAQNPIGDLCGTELGVPTLEMVNNAREIARINERNETNLDEREIYAGRLHAANRQRREQI